MPATPPARPASIPVARRRAVLSAGATLTACLFTSALPGDPAIAAPSEHNALRIAVASNFRTTAETIADRYTQRTGMAVTVSSAASGVLAAQILRGAPFDLFFAADRERAETVNRAGLAAETPSCYARGHLVLLGSDDLETALADPGRSIAIANPRSAPYGIAALAVLERESFAGPDSRRVLRGTNVQQALQFFDSGAADLALVSRSLAGERGIVVPAPWYPAIDQYAVVIEHGGSTAGAEEFLRSVESDEAQRILRHHGYEACP